MPYERKSLIQALYSVCMKYKDVEMASTPFTDKQYGALMELDNAIDDLCRTVGLNRELLEQDCY